MLKVTIPEVEGFNESTNEFVVIPETHLQLEHSLVSLCKWESKWCKSFLSTNDKTTEEILDYIKCMTLTQNVDQRVYNFIPSSVFNEIQEYIQAPMTATKFYNEDKPTSKKIITGEQIYYWMITLNIPFECQKWHLNRLLTLIKVCSIGNSGGKKMSNKEVLARNKALNDARRAKYHSRG